MGTAPASLRAPARTRETRNVTTEHATTAHADRTAYGTGEGQIAQWEHAVDSAAFSELADELTHFMMVYKFGLAEIGTKVTILAEELAHKGRGNPIEHVSPRLKTPASIAAKARRMGCPLTFDDISARIRDIAGIRIVCSFVSDVYTVADMLTRQPDVNLVLTKDYIAEPKPNGYRSLHLIVEIPVFMSERVVAVPVEVQLRTVAMDFWASLEHKIYYKYDPGIPAELRAELAAASEDAARLDQRMERLHRQIHGPRR
ncbi:putative GTP pyrophosphokinase [Pseudosporangium ferrugineum]|uniref:Putative GTP pyrophosphokinase n=1 Tax=Pseudosporangium ferrugineum TaxID=439699 RepID=A0A2T0RUD5_9ACTN|nr:putative GTP pyrophosphokinase [Pseudosporangium ferrugineum]